jgi:hypothetical protein
MDIFCVLSNFYQGQQWSFIGDEYDGLKWNETNTLPKPTLEELTEKWNEYVAAQPLKEFRLARNQVLEQTDKYAIPDWPHSTPEVRQAWLDYRQALRELPSTTEDPENPVWPVRPDEVTEENTSNVVAE